MQYHLENLGLLAIQGEKAKAFLQGQLTCDVEKITQDISTLGAQCNPKGRIISLFYLFNQDDTYYLLMPKNMVEITLAALKKYAIFYKVTLEDVSDEWTYTGFDHVQKLDEVAQLPFSAAQIQIPISQLSERVILVRKASRQEIGSPMQEARWIQKNIAEEIPVIYPATSGKLLPQELNLDAHGGVSYDKGCYTGQEIVARMHYRGKAKSGLYQAVSQMSQSNIDQGNTDQREILPGDLIYASHEEKRECGIVLEASLSQDEKVTNKKLLIVLNDADKSDPQLFVSEIIHTLTIEAKE